MASAPEGLPARPRALVRRAAARQDLEDALLTASSVVVLYGLGGAGKTYLAIDVAHELWEHRSCSAVVWASARDRPLGLEDLLRDAARGLNHAEIAALPFAKLVAAVWETLRERADLLVLDNFDTIETDQQLECFNFLASLVPRSRVLLTSRSIEFVDQIEPALTPRLLPLGGMSRDEAADLIQLQADALAAPQLQNLPPSRLSAMLAATGGVPQALAWLVGQAVDRPLSEVLSELAASSQGPLPALFGTSFQRLGEAARIVLQAVSILAGPISFGALAAVAGLPPSALAEALRQLQRLSLVEDRGALPDGSPRISLHPLTRGFIRTTLQKQAELEAALRARAISYYRTLLRQHGGFQDEAGHDRIGRELETILALVAWCHQEQQWDLVLDLARPLNNFFWMRGYWRERIEYGRLAYQAAAQLGDTWLQGEILAGDVGWTHLQLGELDQAWDCLQDALPLLRQAGHDEELANAWRYLAQIARRNGDIAACRQLLDQAGQAAAQIPERAIRRYAEARTGVDLGYLRLAERRWDEAAAHFHQAGEAFAELGDDTRRAYALNGLGDIALARGEVEQAQARYEASLAIARQIQSKADRAQVSLRLARLYDQRGKRQAAAQWAGESRELFEELGLWTEAKQARALLEQVAAEPPPLKLDSTQQRVWVRGREIHLPPQEFDLLHFLYGKTGEVCPYHAICEHLWPGSPVPYHTLRSQVQVLAHHVRQAIELDPDRPRLLRNVRSRGYRLSLADGSPGR